MENPISPKYLDKKNAKSYDEQRAKLKPIKDALHLCMKIILLDLPKNANILCVGAGTGAELIYLAEEYPQWEFTVVEPAHEMMKLCYKQAEKYGIVSRCTFHEGYLKTLSDNYKFDAATSILVSHFIVNEEERAKYFSSIAKVIKPNGYMINADLSSDMKSSNYNELLNIWVNMHDYAGMPTNIESFGNNVAILPTEDIESIIVDGGFESPILFYKTLFIQAWFSKVNSLSLTEKLA